MHNLKTNYLLIDFENIQPRSLALLNGHSFKAIVFLGANQTKIPVELAKALQAFGENVEYLQVSGSGRNALDFHIAFTLGKLSSEDQGASYYILSKDTGFDPLIKHLKTQGIQVRRSKEIAGIPLLQVSNGKSIREKIDAVVHNLKTRGSSKPRKIGTLKNTINAIFSKSLRDSELTEIINALAQQGYITIEGESISYQLQGAR